MRKNSSGFIHLLLIPVILLLVGACLIFNKSLLNKIVSIGTPMPTQVSEFMTYEENGVYLKYPSFLTLKKMINGYLVFLKDPNDKTTTSSVIDIDLNLNRENSSYEELVNFWKQRLVDEKITELENGVRIEGVGTRESEGVYFTLVILKHGSSAVVFVTNKTSKEDKVVFDQILSTFKFIDDSNSAGGNCKVTGCSGQLCSDEDEVTTCEWTEQYACYKTAKCERQRDGKCGWTMTTELQSCLSND